MVNIKISNKPQASKNVRRVFNSKSRIPMSPIEELSTPVQMERLEPWIKQIYAQAKLTTGTFSKPLKETSQYNNKEEHQPISDWSARVNQEYYNNLIDLELDWGDLSRWGEGDIKPVWYPSRPTKPKPGPIPTPKPKPVPIPPDVAGKDWYYLQWNKITQGTFQGEAVSFLSFWVGMKNQIRKGYENEIFISFTNPYVGLNTRYSKGILIDGLVLDTDTFNEITDRLFNPKELLERINLMMFQRIRFIGDLGDDVILHDTTHGDDEPTLAYKHIPLKEAGVKRAEKETNRVYWLVRSFKVFQIDGVGGSNFFTASDPRITDNERRFIDLIFSLFGLTISDAEFLALTSNEKKIVYDKIRELDI